MAAVIAQANAATVKVANSSSAVASLLWLDDNPPPTLPAPLAHAAAAVYAESRTQMLQNLQKDEQFMLNVQTVRDSLSNLTGFRLLSEVPKLANLHAAHVRFPYSLPKKLLSRTEGRATTDQC